MNKLEIGTKLLYGIMFILVLTGMVNAKPTVILIFDDGWRSILDNAYPIMQNNSQRGVEFIITQEPDYSWNGLAENYMNVTQLQQLYNSGWDLGSHTVSHPELTNAATNLTHELGDSQAWLNSNGFTRGSMFLAYPYGLSNMNVENMAANYYVAARGITEDPSDPSYTLNSPGRYQLPAYVTSGNSDTGDSVIAKINNIPQNGLLILAFHKILPTLDTDPNIADEEFKISDFQKVSDYLKSQESNINVMTLSEYFGLSPSPTPTATPVNTSTPVPNATVTTTPIANTTTNSTNTTVNPANNSTNTTVNVTATPVFTPVSHISSGSSSSSSSSSSGGGSGGGGTSEENYTNIILREKHDMDIYANTTTSYKFYQGTNPIQYVNITGNVNAGEIYSTVEVLRNTSVYANYSAPGKVYQNVNIWVGTAGFSIPRNIKEGVVRFMVENSWIEKNNVDPSKIKLLRWSGRSWNQLEISQKGSDSKYTYFEAKTASFSPFAITELKENPALSQGTPNKSNSTPASINTPVNTTVATKEVPQSNSVPFVGISAIIGICAVVGLLLRRRSRL